MKKFKTEIVHSHSANPSLIALIAKGREEAEFQYCKPCTAGEFTNKQQEQKDISTMELLDKVISISKSSNVFLDLKDLKTKIFGRSTMAWKL